MTLSRVGVIAAVVAAAAAVVVVLFSGGGGHRYTLLFETGGQLVTGNQVLVGGQPIGTVDDIVLADDGQAQVEVTVDEPLHEGTTAVVRLTSLSGIANRYVSVSPGPNSSPELEDDATISGGDTTTPVDLDQLFDTLDEETRASLQDVIQGSGTVYTGNTEEARESYKYFGPALQSGERLLAELNRDQRALTDFLVSGGSVFGAIAERRDDLSSLTQNANEALGAIATENDALDRSLAALPPAMRQANTTFVNLRAALDDLDSLVATAKPATRELPTFLRDLRPLARNAVPVVGDLRKAVATPGPDNDLTDVLAVAPRVERLAEEASEEGIEAINDSQGNIDVFRSYSPDLLSAIAKLGQVTAYYDGNGHYARALPAGLGAFEYTPLPPPADGVLTPTYDSPGSQLDFFTGTPNAFDAAGFERCPGAGSQQAADLSTPFLYDVGGQCDPTDLVIPGAAP